jgi:ribosomal protein S18 acetylase RimI-like enzyme
LGVVEVREATAADKVAVAQVHVRSWQHGYRDLIAQDFLDGLRPEDMATRYAFGGTDPRGLYTLVAIDDAAIRGHITIGRSRDEVGDGGEVWALYVDPSYWGAGVGQALLVAGCSALRQIGYEKAFLSVLATNMRARRFYERNGWTTDGVEQADVLGGVSVQTVRYVTPLGRQT